MQQSSLVRQFLVITVSSLVVVLILIKANVAGRLAYSVEKGRIQALRDSLPSEAEVAARFEPDRAVAAAVLPAVVSISTERLVTRADIEGWHRFRSPEAGAGEEEPEAESEGDEEREQPSVSTNGAPAEAEAEIQFLLPSGHGSGFIVDAENGYVVTNNHVVAGSSGITVRLADGRRAQARLLGADTKTDLAVLQIEADHLHELPWGDSLSMEVGDAVYAVGNPFEYAGTVSRGIISAKNRSNVYLPDVEYQGFLQTDAVINPGNSGGPLVNMRGQVVGINTAIATRSGNYDGVGFAIPAHRAAKLVPKLVRGERITRGYLGVVMVRDGVAEDGKAELGWTEPSGVLVDSIVPHSPASRSDLEPSDIIVAFNGRRVTSNADVIQAVADTSPGTVVELGVWRRQAQVTVAVEVGAQPDGFSTSGRPPRE